MAWLAMDGARLAAAVAFVLTSDDPDPDADAVGALLDATFEGKLFSARSSVSVGVTPFGSDGTGGT